MSAWKFLTIAAIAVAIAGPKSGFRFQPAAAASTAMCTADTHENRSYTVCTIDLRSRKLRLFLKDPDGNIFGSFRALEAWLEKGGRKLAFATNAGMYHADRSPVGLFIDSGATQAPLNLKKGGGNFFMKPNGVFFINGETAQVMATEEYRRRKPAADLATQSGPMLLIDGRLHSRFFKASDSRKIRNGVCVPEKSTVVFALSAQPVNFYTFAEFFRDRLKCSDALYLDGTISALHASDLGRSDFTLPLGPIIAVVD